MSYPLAAPQTYDHPFAYQLPTLTPAPADAAPTQQLPTPPAQNPEHRYAVPAPPHLQPNTGGHFQPQLEPLANPDGSPPFTHFCSSSGTDIANVTSASPEGSTSSNGTTRKRSRFVFIGTTSQIGHEHYRREYDESNERNMCNGWCR
ncbi:SubName: Full=Uncharacterized protein {ECO:0000313/EMBL:CCA74620.1} [Serendipita indica DSM 11827]|nr:SubName: Full=Uncharacterized protein {ECO:0000313/EMBL:CCA74620.1} [Serendipita indica DSM 11827]